MTIVIIGLSFYMIVFLVLIIMGWRALAWTFGELLVCVSVLAFGGLVFTFGHEFVQLAWDVHKGKLVCEIASYLGGKR